MTTNEDRAQRIVGGVIDRLTTDKSGVPVATRITQALADADLLMPDLPEPDGVKLNGDRKFFISGGVQVRHNASGQIWVIPHDQPLTTGQARQVALALLATNHAEQEQEHG